MKHAKPDLTLSAYERPRKITLDLANLNSGNLTLMDALDIVEVSGVQPHRFQATLASTNTGNGIKAKMLYAFAWVLLRRLEPGVTWEEMQTYDLEIVGEMASEEEAERIQQRANAVMGVVRATGVTPAEAEKLTMAQVRAAIPQQRKRRRVG